MSGLGCVLTGSDVITTCRYCRHGIRQVRYLDASDSSLPPVTATAWLYIADGVSSAICPARASLPAGSDRGHLPASSRVRRQSRRRI